MIALNIFPAAAALSPTLVSSSNSNTVVSDEIVVEETPRHPDSPPMKQKSNQGVPHESSFPEMEMDEKTVQRNLQLLEQQKGRMKQQQQEQKEGNQQAQALNKTPEKEFKTSDHKYRDDIYDLDEEDYDGDKLDGDDDEEKLAFFGPPGPPIGPFPGKFYYMMFNVF